MAEGYSEDSIDETTEIISDSENASSKLLREIYKTKKKLDICIKVSTDSSTPFTNEIIKSINELTKKDKKIKTRCITEIVKDNIDYSKQLISAIDEVRHLNNIKCNFLINEIACINIIILQKAQHYNQLLQPIWKLIFIKDTLFLEQQQFFFDLLWDKSIPADQKIKEIEQEKRDTEKELPQSSSLPMPLQQQQQIKTKVLQNQQDILKTLIDFYKNSNEIKFCSAVDGIKLIYKNFFSLHNEILERHKQGDHKGIRLITSVNNQKDVELVKSFLNDGVEIRHVKDLLSINFALSNEAFLFTIEKMEEGKMVTNIFSSNDILYLDHYDTVFENLWKKGIDINDRIKTIEEGHYINVELIPNPKESLKFSRGLLNNAKIEVLVILSSATAIFRVENNIGFEIFDDLAFNGIKVKILIPLGEELDTKISQLKSKYSKIEFRNLHTTLKSLIGITVIDGEKVLLTEIKDDFNIRYIDSIGLTIFIEGKSAALSYLSIFYSLWKQAYLYNEIKKAYKKIQNHDKMQKAFINIAAHELRTPIQPIVGITSILKNEIQSKRHKEFLDVLIRNVQRLKSLSEDILDVMKIEGNSLDLHKEHFKIIETILEVIKNYKNEVAILNITLEYLFADIKIDFVVYADKIRITQVISNLICNSIKFINTSNKQGTIFIIAEKRKRDCGNIGNKDMVVVMVKDNGIGIDEKILPNLFTKFVSKSFQGTGLGLYISKNIVEAHGGRIWAKNNEGEKGATFSFSLPLINDTNDGHHLDENS